MAPYKVLRKTGTSEQQVSGKTVDNAVFIAYAPAEDPVLAVAVVVPEGGFGANGAAPIAREIFDAYDEAIGLHGVPHKPAALQVLLERLQGLSERQIRLRKQREPMIIVRKYNICEKKQMAVASGSLRYRIYRLN